MATPLAVTFISGNGTGTDGTGQNLILAGGKSTGNAAGGNILLQVTQPGDSGTALNTLETAVTISGSNKSMTTAGDIVIPNNGKLGCAADTDLIALANGVVTVNGEINVTTLDIDGTNVSATAAELNILSGVTSTAAELNILDGVTATAAELNILDGDTSASSITVADAHRVVLNDNGTMKQVAVTDLAAYFDDEITAMPNLVTTAATTVGDLDSGSITSGFGNINTGSSTITTTGAISGGSLAIDNVVINGVYIGHTDDTDLIRLANGAVTIGGTINASNLSLTGNLTVNGTTTTVATTNTVVSDRLIELANGASDSTGDAGIVIERGSTGDNAFIGWDESADKFTVGTTTATGTSSGDLSITTGTLVANLEGNVTGNLTGNVTGTTIGHADDTDLITLADGVVTVAGEISATTLDIDGTNVTASAAELNILNGVTATTAELNILDGGADVTSITVEDADRVVLNDNGTMIQVAVTDLATYFDSATSLNSLSDVLIESNSLYIGHDPNNNTSSAERNIAVGQTALDAITTGDDNVCVGQGSGSAITTDSQNTLIGKDAGLVQESIVQVTGQTSQNNGNGNATTIELAEAASSEDDFYNGSVIKITGGGGEGVDIYGQITDYVGSTRIATFRELEGTTVTNTENKSYEIGGGHLADNKTNNVSVGYDSCKALTRGFSNTIVGSESGTSVTTGYRNTTLGYAAGDALTTGYNNTVIGYNSSASSAVIANEVTLGDSNVTTLRCGATTIASLSDRRDKTDIKDSAYGLNLINRVRPVEFTWKTREGSSKDGTTNIGFIAQELQDAMEEGENDKLRLVYESNPDRLEAMYGNLVPVMAKAIQELSQQVEELKARLDKQN